MKVPSKGSRSCQTLKQFFVFVFLSPHFLFFSDFSGSCSGSGSESGKPSGLKKGSGSGNGSGGGSGSGSGVHEVGVVVFMR